MHVAAARHDVAIVSRRVSQRRAPKRALAARLHSGPVGRLQCAEPNDESEERVMGKKKDKKITKAKSAQVAPSAAETAVAPSAGPRRKKS